MRSIAIVVPLVLATSTEAQLNSMSGLVTDAQGTPLAFANVVVQGSEHGTSTSATGRFTITGLSNGDHVIMASSVGYTGRTVTVQVPQRDTPLMIQLMPRVVDLPAFTVQNSMTGGSEFAREVDGSAWYIGTRELEQFAYTDISRILRTVPGVNIQEEDGFGLRPNIGMRGAGAERSAKITVMEDGILIAPAPYASPAAYYFPTMGRMSGIEVVKGSSQIRYGPLTTGGALNLLSTPVPERSSGMVGIWGGSYSTRNVHARAGTEIERIGVLVETFQQASDGFKQLDNNGNTGFSKSDYLTKVQWHTADTTLWQQAISVKMGYTTEMGNETYLGLSQADFASTPYRRYSGSQEDRIDVEHDLLTAQYAITIPQGPRLTFTGYRTNTFRNWYKLDQVADRSGSKVSIADLVDRSELYPEEFGTITGVNSEDNALMVKANQRNYQTSGLQFIAAHTVEKDKAIHDLEAGIRLHGDFMDRFQHYDGYRMQGGDMLLTNPGAPGSESNRIASAEAVAAHLLYVLQIGRVGIRPGLRYEHITMEEDNYGKQDPGRDGADLVSTSNTVDVWIPGIGFDFTVHEHVTTFIGMHKGFSPPGPLPETKPESSINYELGVRMEKGGLDLQVIGFMNDYDELLGADMAASGGSGTGELFNGGEAMVQGVECFVSHDPLYDRSDRWRMPITIGYTYTDARFGSTFNSTFEGWGNVLEGDRIPYIPVNQMNARIALEGRKASVSFNATFIDDIPAGTGPRTEEGNDVIPAFTVMDLAASYRWSAQAELFCTVQNLLNDVYLVSLVPAGARPGAPRIIQAGMRMRF